MTPEGVWLKDLRDRGLRDHAASPLCLSLSSTHTLFLEGTDWHSGGPAVSWLSLLDLCL